MKKPVLIILCFIIGFIAGCGPTPPNGGPAITAVAGGEGHTLALTSTGDLYAWGLNNRGQLGNGGTTDSHVPVQITLPAGITLTALAAGGAHSVALTSNGQVYTWGWNSSGQLGIGSTVESHTPGLVPNLNNIIAISARHNHTVALKNDGTVWAWGKNDCGQLGNGNTTNQLSPVQVRGQNDIGYLTDIKAIASGLSHTVALTNGGEIYAWGQNAFGQLGDCTVTSSNTPVKARVSSGGSFLSNIEAIAAGTWHTLAEKTNGDVYAWGKNVQGQLSQPVIEPYRIEIPTKISGNSINITGAMAIDAGWDYSVALLADGKVCAWGTNDNGEMGIEVTGDQVTPVYTHLPTGVKAQFVSAGSGHMLLVTPGGALYDWGSNLLGQLGIGSTTNSLKPVKVNF